MVKLGQGAPGSVLMFGTEPAGRGGVAAVISVLLGLETARRCGVRFIATHAEVGALRKLALFGAAVLALLWACCMARPRIVHVHAASRASFVRKSLLLAIARAAGCRTVFHLHGGEFELFATREAGPLLRRWIRHTLEASSVVLVLAPSWAEVMQGLAPRARVQLLPNAVPLAPPDEAARQPGRILFLGRPETAKGIGELLDAVAGLAARDPAVQLVVGGAGDLAAVQAQAARLGIGARVSVLGWISRDQVERELAQASVLALPSYNEGLPMAVLEAMAAGKAVVASAVGGLPQLITDGENGLLVAPRDSAALTAALARLLDDEALRARLGAAARRTIEAGYSSAAMEQRLEAVYAALDKNEG